MRMIVTGDAILDGRDNMARFIVRANAGKFEVYDAVKERVIERFKSELLANVKAGKFNDVNGRHQFSTIVVNPNGVTWFGARRMKKGH